jgi:hypothetical protein
MLFAAHVYVTMKSVSSQYETNTQPISTRSSLQTNGADVRAQSLVACARLAPMHIFVCIEMVQTREGVKHNPWVAYLKECAKDYKEQRAALGTSKGGDVPRKRVTGKKSDGVTEKDNRALRKTVTHTAKAKAKEKAKEASSAAKKSAPVTEKDNRALQKTVTHNAKAKAKEKAMGAVKK